MSSKEVIGIALENCDTLARWEGGSFEEDLEILKKGFKEIEKDLEILQILKNYMIIFNKNEIRIYLYGKEMKKFKEWLENETYK